MDPAVTSGGKLWPLIHHIRYSPETHQLSFAVSGEQPSLQPNQRFSRPPQAVGQGAGSQGEPASRPQSPPTPQTAAGLDMMGSGEASTGPVGRAEGVVPSFRGRGKSPGDVGTVLSVPLAGPVGSGRGTSGICPRTTGFFSSSGAVKVTGRNWGSAVRVTVVLDKGVGVSSRTAGPC